MLGGSPVEDAKTLHFAREQLVELLLFVTKGFMGFLILPIKKNPGRLVYPIRDRIILDLLY